MVSWVTTTKTGKPHTLTKHTYTTLWKRKTNYSVSPQKTNICATNSSGFVTR